MTNSRLFNRPVALQGELQLLERRVVDVEHHQVGGGELADLAAQLRTDRPARAGDQHPLVAEIVGDVHQPGAHLIAAEQVVGGHRLEVLHRDRVEQLGDRGQVEHLQPQLVCVPPDRRPLVRRARGHGQHEHIGAGVFCYIGQVGPRAPHRHRPNPQVGQPSVVVEETHRVQVGILVQHGVDRPAARRAGPEDQRRALAVAGVARRPQLLARPPQAQAHAQLHGGGEWPGQEGGGHLAAGVGDQQRAQHQADRGDRGCPDDPVHLLDRPGPPRLAVQTGGPARTDLQPGGEEGQQQGVADVERLAGFDEGQRRGGEHGEKPRQRVERAHDGATMHAAQPLDDGRGSGAKW
jgi:hypothetical protein